MKTKIDMTPRQASMALHLAKLIGLLEPSLSKEIRVFYKEAVWHPVGLAEFNPFNDKVQWADVVLWLFSNDYDVFMAKGTLANSPDTVMDATMEYSARQTGWKETTHQE